MEENIQSNTCEIIGIDKKTVTDVETLKKEYLKIKEKILKEIIEELIETSKDVVSSDPSTPD
jgi:hypothetical protein